MTPRELKRMMAAVAALSADEIETVKKALSVREGQVVKSAVEQARMASVRACPHCGSVRFVKDGHANGRQRFRCRETGCARTFNALTGTPLARLHMPEKHLENARLMAAGLSVRVTAERLGVSVPTAFKWRHRFLQAPLNQQPGTLSGLVETDETYLLESFKGQRGGLPRPPKKRGTPGRTRGLGPDQIPVLVAREREMKAEQGRHLRAMGDIHQRVLDIAKPVVEKIREEQRAANVEAMLKTRMVNLTRQFPAMTDQELRDHYKLVTTDEERAAITEEADRRGLLKEKQPSE